jgi:membrane protein DedA with SNARE-associated domain
VLGCLPWCLFLAWLGFLLGARWETVERVFRPFAWAIALLVLAGGVWFVVHRVRSIRREEQERRARASEARVIEAQGREASEDVR